MKTFFSHIKTGAILGSAGALFIPQSTLAAPRAQIVGTGNSTVSNFRDLVMKISEMINLVIPIVISLTVLVFIWGIFRMVLAGGDTDARKEARSTIVFGIVGLFVMVSVWGLVNILKSSFFGGGLVIPQLK